MYKGDSSDGEKFYSLLLESHDFTSELGKVSLASGRLEAELILFLIRKGINGNYYKATLGKLIELGQKNNLFDKNLTMALKQISEQRNYLTHNIYALFVDLIEETVLERSNLIDSDVQTYVARAWQLRENLVELANIIHEKN
jgi:hypothetical protein